MPSAMTPFSAQDYELVHWTLLRDTLDTLLTCQPGTFKPISYEQMYSAVYKCVCRQYGERLYGDLTAHLASYVDSWRNALVPLDGEEFVIRLHHYLSQYLFALGSVVPIFTYLNRFYVESKLQTDLDTALVRIFAEKLGDELAPRAVELLGRADLASSLAPSVVQALVRNLHRLDGRYADLRPELFARFLPGVGATPMCEDDLERQAEADRRLQEDLRRAGFGTGDQSRKRALPGQGEDGEEDGGGGGGGTGGGGGGGGQQ